MVAAALSVAGAAAALIPYGLCFVLRFGPSPSNECELRYYRIIKVSDSLRNPNVNHICSTFKPSERLNLWS